MTVLARSFRELSRSPRGYVYAHVRRDLDNDGVDTLASDSLELTLDGDDKIDPDYRTPVSRSPRYHGGTILGRGGMGEVIAAFDIQIGREVAI